MDKDQTAGGTVGNVTKLNVVMNPALPPDLPGVLRQLADDVEAGKVTEMIVGYVQGDTGTYKFLWPSSTLDSLTLTTLAHAEAVDRMRSGG